MPAVLFVLAVMIALARLHGPAAERFLAWILLLQIGVTGLWAGVFHIFFPEIAACVAFSCELGFKAAAVSAASIFLLGDEAGDVRQMMVAGNFAPGNAGLPFYMDIICPLLALKRARAKP